MVRARDFLQCRMQKQYTFFCALLYLTVERFNLKGLSDQAIECNCFGSTGLFLVAVKTVIPNGTDVAK